MKKKKRKKSKYSNHREIFKMFHGREIEPHKEIHHADGDPKNNHPENLKELSPEKHREVHRMAKKNKMKVKRATKFIEELDKIEEKIREKA